MTFVSQKNLLCVNVMQLWLSPTRHFSPNRLNFDVLLRYKIVWLGYVIWTALRSHKTPTTTLTHLVPFLYNNRQTNKSSFIPLLDPLLSLFLYFPHSGELFSIGEICVCYWQIRFLRGCSIIPKGVFLPQAFHTKYGGKWKKKSFELICYKTTLPFIPSTPLKWGHEKAVLVAVYSSLNNE